MTPPLSTVSWEEEDKTVLILGPKRNWAMRTDRQWFPVTLVRTQNLKPRVLSPMCPHVWGGRGLLPPSVTTPFTSPVCVAASPSPT